MDSIIAGQKIARRRSTPAKRGGGKPASKPGRSSSGPAGTTAGGTILSRKRAAPRGPAASSPRNRAGTALARFAGAARGFARATSGRLTGRATSLGPARAALLALAVVAVATLLCSAAAAILRGPSFPMPSKALLPEETVSADLLLEYSSPELAGASDDPDAAGQDLPPPPATLSYSMYTVRNGDTLGAIAKRSGLALDSLISANGISNARAVKSGTALRIPSMDGLVHRVRAGESLTTIAKRYKVETTRILDANDLGSAMLTPGQSLFIPGARLAEADLKQVLGELIAWPARGRLSSYFGYRPDPFTGIRRFHGGLDIVMNTGTAVRSAAAGVVSDVGYNANYGNYIIVTHGGGLQTLYGHLSSTSIAKGAKVAQGTMIGLSGNTGYSTGPHLHFGIYKAGVGINPLKYLK
jgi:murein DD-endopeptidase MepM/ murein hydrolase activator NlpD